MEIHLREVLATTRRMAEIVAFHSGQPLEKVEHDIDRDYFMTAQDAKAYGIIDDIIVPARGVCGPDGGTHPVLETAAGMASAPYPGALGT